jgi:hypothetical protein
MLLNPLKPVLWVGNALERLRNFPKNAARLWAINWN